MEHPAFVRRHPKWAALGLAVIVVWPVTWAVWSAIFPTDSWFTSVLFAIGRFPVLRIYEGQPPPAWSSAFATGFLVVAAFATFVAYKIHVSRFTHSNIVIHCFGDGSGEGFDDVIPNKYYFRATVRISSCGTLPVNIHSMSGLTEWGQLHRCAPLVARELFGLTESEYQKYSDLPRTIIALSAKGKLGDSVDGAIVYEQNVEGIFRDADSPTWKHLTLHTNRGNFTFSIVANQFRVWDFLPQAK